MPTEMQFSKIVPHPDVVKHKRTFFGVTFTEIYLKQLSKLFGSISKTSLVVFRYYQTYGRSIVSNYRKAATNKYSKDFFSAE